ncbi:MAG: RnfABCDGE type electron transport complex subunit D [Calditrichia bacterium]
MAIFSIRRWWTGILQASFPVAITTWSPFGDFGTFATVRGNSFALPFLKSAADGVTSATPLSQMKFEGKIAQVVICFLGTSPVQLAKPAHSSSCWARLYLIWRNFMNWRIPVSIFLTVFVLSGVLYFISPDKFAPPLFHLFSGGLMLGAVYMATDPVSSPITQRGCWIYGAGIGIMVIVIRNFGGLPEGVMYAILLMNAATPLINRVTHPGNYGRVKPAK